jgi:hypothetical protein
MLDPNEASALAAQVTARVGTDLMPQVPKWEGWYHEVCEGGCANARELLGGAFISASVILMHDFDRTLTKEKFLDIVGGVFDSTMASIASFERAN